MIASKVVRDLPASHPTHTSCGRSTEMLQALAHPRTSPFAFEGCAKPATVYPSDITKRGQEDGNDHSDF